ncbi:thiosulfate sulfurtransferase GlpE [Thalassotalea crassostreae]|uniref:thiosulfate sulfurtransferase GlpE n=1 Tax=Thalassotalea crassostreae TaxID=1763536 RepID=UPI000839ADB1|nr:thiosulfate sulfurtransferase GlpE [Thalassotalea crassostreae]
MEQDTFIHMNVVELEQQMGNKEIVVVDIRDANSFALNHIPGSIHLTNDNLGDFLRDADFDVPTVVCCYHGISSQQAAQFLISQDFTEVYSLDGGFEGWQQAFPTLMER